MIKAAFFDVDGTLVPYGGKAISDQLREDLLALRRRGVKIFLATGRGRRDLESTGMLRDVVFDAYVLFTGQLCCNEREVYRDIPLVREDLERACGVLRRNPETVAILETAQGNFLNQVNDQVRELSRAIHTDIYPVRPPEELLEGQVYQLVLVVERGQEEPYLSVMPNCTYARWHPLAIDVIPKGDGKADGIQATLDYYGLNWEEVIAFGDADNDLSMLRLAGIGVAMGNGEESAKAAADYVTGPVDQDGVSAALRHFGLLPELAAAGKNSI